MIRCVVAEDEHILRKGLVLTTDWKSLGCERWSFTNSGGSIILSS